MCRIIKLSYLRLPSRHKLPPRARENQDPATSQLPSLFHKPHRVDQPRHVPLSLLLRAARWMQEDHILSEAGDKKVRRLLKLLLNIVLQQVLHVVSPVIRVGPLAPPYWSGYVLPVVVYFLDFFKNFQCLLAVKVGEKLLNVGQLLNRDLVIELLVVGTVVLVVRRNGLLPLVFIVRGPIHSLLLLLEVVELELAARGSS